MTPSFLVSVEPRRLRLKPHKTKRARDLMNAKALHVRVDPERVETDPIIEPGRCVWMSEIKSDDWQIRGSSLKSCQGLRTLGNVRVSTVPVKAELNWSRQ